MKEFLAMKSINLADELEIKKDIVFKTSYDCLTLATVVLLDRKCEAISKEINETNNEVEQFKLMTSQKILVDTARVLYTYFTAKSMYRIGVGRKSIKIAGIKKLIEVGNHKKALQVITNLIEEQPNANKSIEDLNAISHIINISNDNEIVELFVNTWRDNHAECQQNKVCLRPHCKSVYKANIYDDDICHCSAPFEYEIAREITFNSKYIREVIERINGL